MNVPRGSISTSLRTVAKPVFQAAGANRVATGQGAADTEFHQTMFELHQTVNKNELIVGW